MPERKRRPDLDERFVLPVDDPEEAFREFIKLPVEPDEQDEDSEIPEGSDS